MKNLFKSVGIAIISTLIYAIYVSENERESEQYQKKYHGPYRRYGRLFQYYLYFQGVDWSRFTSGGGSPISMQKPPF